MTNQRPQTLATEADPVLHYAHQGCYLAFPDIGFYRDEAPWVDEAALARDAGLMLKEIRGAAEMGCSAFIHLMSSVDDFVSYDWLHHPDLARREERAAALAQTLRGLVTEAHRLGLSYHVQTYELLLDREVAGLVTRQNVRDVLERKYGEFFRRTGVDGLFLTPSEAHPRGNSVWVDLWGGKEGAAEMAADFNEVIVRRLGKQLVFRLWLMAETDAEWEQLRGRLPAGLPLCAKNTASDFWNRVPLNPALRRKADAPLHVIFDVFGQYHGWGKLLYFDALWEPSLQQCRQSGATIQMWGSWTPFCISPNEAPHVLTGPQPCAWVGRSADLGLWEPGHLGGRLSMRWLVHLARGAGTGEAMEQAASDCGLPAGDAKALQAASPLVMRLWDEMHTLHRGQLVPLLHQWATIYQSPRKTWREFLEDGGRGEILESNRRAAEDLAALRAAGAALKDAELRRTWDRTCLYFETSLLGREAACADTRFAGGNGASADLLDRLETCLRAWQDYAPENTDWFITGVNDARFSTRKRWLRGESLAEYVAKLRTGATDPVPEGPAFSMATWNGR